MKVDVREEAARFYDASPEVPNDVPFYQGLIASPGISVLELGCGTGRVLLPLVASCKYIQGIDLSPAMISICRDKLLQAGIPTTRARVQEGDITGFELGRVFDFIIAPFRVLQNLESDAEVDGLFRCIHKHLASGGTCVLNVFRPNREPEVLRRQWVETEEKRRWEAPVEGGTVVCFDRRARMDAERLVLYPELIYRRFAGETLAEETVLQLVMRCYYPDTFEKLIVHHGFAVLNRWGGYAGEVYGQGPELVIQFRQGN
jgi:SAM-dependent methyltransferase